MVDRKRRTESELAEIARGRIPLGDEGEVIDAWMQAFSASTSSISAINLVTPDYWLAGSEFSAKQSEIQSGARQRGVTIRRIFVLATSSKEEAALVLRVGEQQRRIGIDVRFTNMARVLNSPAYGKSAPALGNAVDLVLFDLNIALLTYTDPRTHQIQRGILSSERSTVDAAALFFEHLWTIAEPRMGQDMQ